MPDICGVSVCLVFLLGLNISLRTSSISGHAVDASEQRVICLPGKNTPGIEQ